MRGTSRSSLADAQDRVETLLERPGTDRARLGDDLFAVASLLDHTVALRRALTDPSRAPEDKAALAGRLLEGKVSGEAVDVVGGLVRARWSSAADLADAIEQLGALALVAGAEQTGHLDEVEDELFRFTRVVSADHDLARVLSDAGGDSQRREDLAARLLEGKVTPETAALVRHAVRAPRGHSVVVALERMGRIAAKRRERLIADVVAAIPLTSEQRTRLGAVLERLYGRPIQLNVDVDPAVVGGLRVRVGDEVVDATVLGRLDTARRGLTGR